MSNVTEYNFESLRDKLLKLQALVERGFGGEAENARRAIERICKQYGLKLEDVLDVETKHEYRFEIGKGKDMMNLFVRCVSMVCDIKGMQYYKPTRSSICIEVTAMQYADISSLFNWHLANYKHELDDFRQSFLDAYILKHNLYFDTERNGTSNKELTKEDVERIRRIINMRNAMNDKTYHKQIEG